MKSADFLLGSFRDISGYVFSLDSAIYRQINKIAKEDYDLLMNSGLYEELIKNELLIPHKEVDKKIQKRIKGKERLADVYKIIKPEPIPFISYPYEWCFSQLKDSALLTLRIQKKALEYGMSLKDSSAYNVQFRNGKPVFIDTLSFEKYQEGSPWGAYYQFCQHFLAPLSLMKYKDQNLNRLLKDFFNGIPLKLTSSLLSFRSYFRIALLTHIHLHAKGDTFFAKGKKTNRIHQMSRHQFLSLIDSLQTGIKKLRLEKQSSNWSIYYQSKVYSESSFQHKAEIVEGFLQRIKAGIVWDLGSNTGFFSRLAGKYGSLVISIDIDPNAGEINYQRCINEEKINIIPLVMDLCNPSPGIGWKNRERPSFIERARPDTIMALAIVHHLVIKNNISFRMLAEYFAKLCKNLIIEFIPENDEQVMKFFLKREKINSIYTEKLFKKNFSKFFTVISRVKINGSNRSLYMMKRKSL